MINSSASWQSWLLVGLQFGIAGVLVLHSDLNFNFASVMCFLVGAGLGGSAVLTMGIGNFNVVPDVKLNSRLVHQHLPYRLIRHPMYVSLSIICAGLVLQPFSWVKLLEFIALIIVLDRKARYEEYLLQQRFSEYSTYQQRSYRFIPYIY